MDEDGPVAVAGMVATAPYSFPLPLSSFSEPPPKKDVKPLPKLDAAVLRLGSRPHRRITRGCSSPGDAAKAHSLLHGALATYAELEMDSYAAATRASSLLLGV
jgi:hypothetical protein